MSENKNKKTFILYKNWRSSVKKMSNEQAGELFKAIFDFQDNQEPSIDDMSVEFVFEIMKEKMAEDLETYEETCKRRSEAGKKGNEARWGTDDKENRKCDKNIAKIASAMNLSQSIADVKSVSQSIAKIADNDNDCDSDNDIENDNDLLKEKDNPKGLSKEKAQKINFHKGTNVENAQKWIQSNQSLVDFIKSKPKVWSLIKLWLEYKDERTPRNKHHYGTQRGLSTIINRIVDNYKTYGYEAVKYAIDESISHEWDGLIWDVMERKYQPLPPEEDIEAEKEQHIRKVYMDTRSCYPLAENTEENYQAFKRRLARDSLVAEDLRDEILAYVRWFETETDRQDIPTFAEYLDEGKR